MKDVEQRQTARSVVNNTENAETTPTNSVHHAETKNKKSNARILGDQGSEIFF